MIFPELHYIRRGVGKPLLLIHGLGGTWRSWEPVLKALSAERDVIAIDLPGFGDSSPLAGECSIQNLADAVTYFLSTRFLMGIDAVGISAGGRLVLELARRGCVVGHVIALSPTGFGNAWQRRGYYFSTRFSIRLLRFFYRTWPALMRRPRVRSFLLSKYSVRAGRLDHKLTLDELHGWAIAPAFDELLHQLVFGARPQGAPQGSITIPLIIAWGRHDRICSHRQSKCALKLFPDARFHMIEESGHYCIWDAPEKLVRLILEGTRFN